MVANGITVTLAYTLHEDFTEQFCRELPGMIQQTATRPGFRNIRIVRNLEQPNDILFVEEWDSQSDYMAYIEWRRSRGDLAGREQMFLKRELKFWPEIIAQA